MTNTTTVPVRLSSAAAERLADLVRTVPALDVANVRPAGRYVFCDILITGTLDEIDTVARMLDRVL